LVVVVVVVGGLIFISIVAAVTAARSLQASEDARMHLHPHWSSWYLHVLN
jgi:nicotinamide riboside transporter PnuC